MHFPNNWRNSLMKKNDQCNTYPFEKSKFNYTYFNGIL